MLFLVRPGNLFGPLVTVNYLGKLQLKLNLYLMLYQFLEVPISVFNSCKTPFKVVASPTPNSNKLSPLGKKGAIKFAN